MGRYCTKPRTRKYVEGYGFLSLGKIYLANTKKNQLMQLQNQEKVI